MGNSIERKTIDGDFFLVSGFVKNEAGRYEKQFPNQRVEFELFDYDSTLGTNIEHRVNGMLMISGYWHDTNDFRTTFELPKR